jgi:hypothetical protein
MTLYSFKGHYPVEVIDNNKGWYEVPAKPEAPEGKQVAWLNGEWVVRDPKPEDRLGYQWNWNHGEMAWVECEYPLTAVIEEEIEEGDEVVDPPLVVDPTEPTPVTASAVVSNEFDITVDGQPI